MIINTVIAQLKAANTSFGNNIAGAAEFNAAQTQTYSVDRLFVIPLASATTGNTSEIGLTQIISEQFGVVAAVNNTVDARGQTAYEGLDAVRTEIFSAILNWMPPGAKNSISFAGGSLLGMNRVYLWWQFAFSYDIQITDSDGLQVVGDPFLHANVEIDKVDEETRVDAEDDIFLPGP